MTDHLGVPSWVERSAQTQTILNSTRGPAHHTPCPTPPGPIPVTARIDWEHDGVEHIDTVALGWTRTHVLIQLHDPRWTPVTAWIPADDVTRRARLVISGQDDDTGLPPATRWVPSGGKPPSNHG